MSRQYDRYERRSIQVPAPRRHGFGHWIPLVLTVTVATIGLAAWIWSERHDDEEDYDGPDRRPPPQGTVPPPGPPGYGQLPQGETGYGTTAPPPEESSNYMARMSGALKRTPSPQQFFDGASRTVVAGVAAAGAVVGNALSSIREEDKNAYKDHKTWSEEAESRKAGASTRITTSETRTQTQRGPPSSGNGKRKTIAVVVSADEDGDGLDDGDDHPHEHAVCIMLSPAVQSLTGDTQSIISHLPHNIDFSKIRLFVLIYSPFLKEHPLDTSSSRPPASLSSSFSNIGHDQVLTPGEESEKPL
jgi:hypothetical protein